MKQALVFLLDRYQKWISPMLGHRCRFFPSCSEYGKEAIERKGPLAGLFMTTIRLLKCHPFHPGGYDPVKP
ncbi:MAG: membrane protein insertion efficiency factor YidD [Candidatus Omnitrophica bacterium]|nr:membrane protein insertion efficiency factor YidD [Candidatus Omnitrophota bacterium]